MESNIRLGANVHGPGDAEEIALVEKIALEDDRVKSEIAKLGLPEGTAVISDPWIYGRTFLICAWSGGLLTIPGSDGIQDDRRMYQAFLYMRDPSNPADLNSNHYAFPLPISPVVDTVDLTVSRIDYLPTGSDHSTKEPEPVNPPKANEYSSEYQDLRTDLKPLNVTQPQGASFRVTKAGETGEIVDWQKWSFRVGFNQREGMVLYDVRASSDILHSHYSIYYCRFNTKAGASSIASLCQT